MTSTRADDPPTATKIVFLHGRTEDRAGRDQAWQQLRRMVATLLPARWFEVHELGGAEVGFGQDHCMLERVGGPPVGSFHLWHEAEQVRVRALPELNDPADTPPWQAGFPTAVAAVRGIGETIDAQLRQWMWPAVRPAARFADGVLIELRPDLIRAHVSGRCREILGFRPAELLGEHPRAVIHPQDWPRIPSLLRLCRRSGQTVHDIHRVRHGAGHYAWLQGQYSPNPDGGYTILLHEVAGERWAGQD